MTGIEQGIIKEYEEDGIAEDLGFLPRFTPEMLSLDAMKNQLSRRKAAVFALGAAAATGLVILTDRAILAHRQTA